MEDTGSYKGWRIQGDLKDKGYRMEGTERSKGWRIQGDLKNKGYREI